MYRWAWMIAAIYALIVVALIVPAAASSVMAAKGDHLWSGWRLIYGYSGGWEAALEIMALLVLAQLALLWVPVRVASRRPVTRGPLWVTALAAAGAIIVLLLGVALCVREVYYADAQIDEDIIGPGGFGALICAGWLAWALYFHSATRPAFQQDATRRVTRFLWSGSVLELLIAVPSHVVTRRRGYCCAGSLTAVGLACGLAVMLFAFGPAVYVLFVDRWRRLHPAVPGTTNALTPGTTSGT